MIEAQRQPVENSVTLQELSTTPQVLVTAEVLESALIEEKIHSFNQQVLIGALLRQLASERTGRLLAEQKVIQLSTLLEHQLRVVIKLKEMVSTMILQMELGDPAAGMARLAASRFGGGMRSYLVTVFDRGIRKILPELSAHSQKQLPDQTSSDSR